MTSEKQQIKLLIKSFLANALNSILTIATWVIPFAVSYICIEVGRHTSPLLVALIASIVIPISALGAIGLSNHFSQSAKQKVYVWLDKYLGGVYSAKKVPCNQSQQTKTI